MGLPGQRHPATTEIFRFFSYEHLKDEGARARSMKVHDLAASMIEELPDSPELTTGLRKLLEAKDCFVRAGIPPEV